MKIESNPSDRCLSPETFVLSIRSASWRSKIESCIQLCQQRQRDLAKIHFEIELETALRVAGSCENAIAIVELPDRFHDDPTATLKSLCRFSNNPQRFPVFALGGFACEPWRNVLRTSGVADSCFSMLDLAAFWNRVQRYQAWAPAARLSVENAVTARLPW